jgi:hypothetical protein
VPAHGDAGGAGVCARIARKASVRIPAANRTLIIIV